MVLSTSRAVAQKAYKKAKKKRRRIKKAQKKQEMERIRQNNQLPSSSSSPSSTLETQRSSMTKAPPGTKWHRIGKEDGCKKAVDRPVDEELVNSLLEKRSKAKAEKKYDESDEITATLVELEIVYDDAMKEWHTRQLSTVAKKAKMELLAKKRQRQNE